MTILTVVGVGACDHVLQLAMLGRLHLMPAAGSLLPFVRMSHAQPSSCQWIDVGGEARSVIQVEGGEQGTLLGHTKFGQDQPDQVWDNQHSPCFCEGVTEGRQTLSHKHGLCPPCISTGLHVEHRWQKAGNAPHEGGLGVQGFGVLVFRVWGSGL